MRQFLRPSTRSLRSSLPLLALSALSSLLATLAGCGGKTADPSSQPGDSGVTDTLADTEIAVDSDAPPARAGWHSYDATITDGHLDWGGSGPSDLPTTFTSPWKGRLDLHTSDAGVIDRAVISPPYDDATEYRLGAAGTLVSVGDGYGVSFGTDADLRVSAHAQSLTVRGDTLTGAGDASYFEGDVGFTGKATFSIVRAEDTTAPSWQLPTRGAFADLPLPWEEQQLILAEPVDPGAPDGPDAIFSSDLHASLAMMLTTPKWLGATEASDAAQLRGLSITTDQWDRAPSWKIDAPALFDFAHNTIAATTLTPKVATVLTLESASLPGTADPSIAHTWGAFAVDPICHDGTSACFHLGPATASYCTLATQAGIAVSLSGASTRYAIEVRALGTPTLAGGGGGTPPTEFAYVQRATPSTAPVAESIAFGTGTTTGGVWDSGWQRIEKPLSAVTSTVKAAGVAISVGGMGNFGGAGSTDCGGPAPPPWKMDVYVRLIAIEP